MKKIVFAVLFGFISVGFFGCSHQPPIAPESVQLIVDQSHTRIKVGEAVTYTARASGVTGREETIKWKSSGGELTLLHEQRYARVVYDTPGVYNIEASMTVEGSLVSKASATVIVEALD